MGFMPGYRGFLEFAEAVGLALEPFQGNLAFPAALWRSGISPVDTRCSRVAGIAP